MTSIEFSDSFISNDDDISFKNFLILYTQCRAMAVLIFFVRQHCMLFILVFNMRSIFQLYLNAIVRSRHFPHLIYFLLSCIIIINHLFFKSMSDLTVGKYLSYVYRIVISRIEKILSTAYSEQTDQISKNLIREFRAHQNYFYTLFIHYLINSLYNEITESHI